MKNTEIKCIVFDYANTLSSDLFFKTTPEKYSNWRELFQKHIFSDAGCLTDWCQGKLSSRDIAQRMQAYVDMSIESILSEMQNGSKNLEFNTSVMNFAIRQKQCNRKTALVTANIDMFSDVVVPFHRLDHIFDVIINSAEYKNDNKLELWPIAFDCLGEDISYANSLLIDDSEKWTARFQNSGGQVYKYNNDPDFDKWLTNNRNLY